MLFEVSEHRGDILLTSCAKEQVPDSRALALAVTTQFVQVAISDTSFGCTIFYCTNLVVPVYNSIKRVLETFYCI